MVIVLGLNDLRKHAGTQYAQLKIPGSVQQVQRHYGTRDIMGLV